MCPDIGPKGLGHPDSQTGPCHLSAPTWAACASLQGLWLCCWDTPHAGESTHFIYSLLLSAILLFCYVLWKAWKMCPGQGADEVLFLPRYGIEKQDDNKLWVKKKKKKKLGSYIMYSMHWNKWVFKMIMSLSPRPALPWSWTSGAGATFAACYVCWSFSLLLFWICLQIVMGPFLFLPHILWIVL